jgi:hypothetical protein
MGKVYRHGTSRVTTRQYDRIDPRHYDSSHLQPRDNLAKLPPIIKLR